MRFGGKMNYPVKVIFFEQICNSLFINDICLFEKVILFCFDISQVFKVTGICKLIGIDNPVIRISLNESPDNM